ncbi:START domain protein [Dictyocaulus viviparus]|uniref:START domain protein n=1 Tax=Dictyocaulus viviparus TaxID=29172 RepID=A0A0D8XAL2_DICVI|nr:START domain protein [Dictyocaulus viviparus]
MSGRSLLLNAESPILSKDRRRFIIISIFDASLITLLWLLCTVTKGDDWRKAFLQEVNLFDPNFMNVSLFDIVLCAAVRMVVLILFFAVFVVHHWLPVAVTTSLSTIYIVIKILFFFSHKQEGLPQYLLVLASFSIAWFELWLVPFKVLPGERICEHRDSFTNILNESASVSGNFLAEARRHNPISRSYISEDEFRSAVEFSSDDESRHRYVFESQKLNEELITTELKAIYEKSIKDAHDKIQSELRQARLGEWKILKCNGPMILQSPNSSYYIRSEFPCSPLTLFNAAWRDVPQWNKQLLDGRVLGNIDSVTDLYYSISRPFLKGYIGSRDFVDLRRIYCDAAIQVYFGVFVSVDFPPIPEDPTKKIIRGVNGPSCIRTGCDAATGKSYLEWIMCTDLRGGLPKRLTKSKIHSYLIDHIKNLHEFIERLPERQESH